MDLEPDNIHIGEYWLKLPPKEVLQAKLHKAMVEAKTRLELRREGGGMSKAKTKFEAQLKEEARLNTVIAENLEKVKVDE